GRGGRGARRAAGGHGLDGAAARARARAQRRASARSARLAAPVRRGVYQVGHTRLTAKARLWAAILACGGPDAAVIRHLTAGPPWELLRTPRVIDVITLRQGSSTEAIRVHRTRTLRPADVTTIDGLPVTTPTRTLIDLADVLTPHRLERACHRAE